MSKIDRVKKIKKQTENRFLNLYEFEVERRNGTIAPYYVASRNSNMESLKAMTHDAHANGVIVYAVYGENKDKNHVLNNFTICDGCRAAIESNVGLYNHTNTAGG